LTKKYGIQSLESRNLNLNNLTLADYFQHALHHGSDGQARRIEQNRIGACD
jgi:hypothetical protein